jgi:molecular chaperone DnaK
VVYSTEKFLAENEDKVPADVKSEVKEAIADLKKAIAGNDIDAIKTASEKAATVSQKMGSAIYAAAQAKQQRRKDMVDAEIVDNDNIDAIKTASETEAPSRAAPRDRQSRIDAVL